MFIFLLVGLILNCFGINLDNKIDCKGLISEECRELALNMWGITIDDYNSMTPIKKHMVEDQIECAREDICPLDPPLPSIINQRINCVDNKIETINATYACNNIDLLSFITLRDLGSVEKASGNDIWVE